MLILAIDPGTVESGWCALDDGSVTASGVLENSAMRDMIRRSSHGDILAIEMIASYGMPVGREVFETCVLSANSGCSLCVACVGSSVFDSVLQVKRLVLLCLVVGWAVQVVAAGQHQGQYGGG